MFVYNGEMLIFPFALDAHFQNTRGYLYFTCDLCQTMERNNCSFDDMFFPES